MSNTNTTDVTAQSPEVTSETLNPPKFEVRTYDSGPRLVASLTGELTGRVRIPIAKLGTWIKGKQRFSITRQTLSDIVANLRKKLAETVIDYEHASEFPESAQGQPIPAAGWLKEIEDMPDENGVIYAQAEFTPRAQQMIQNGEYKYISPVIDWGARDKATGEAQGATLSSVALTNRPFLEALPALALSERGERWQEFIRGDAVEERRTNVTKAILSDRVARTVRLVADDGSETTVTLEGLEAPLKVVRLSDVKRTSEGVLDFAGIQTGDDVLIASDVLNAMRVDSKLEAAVKAGKITPAQRPHFEKLAINDMAAFDAVVATMPNQVELSEQGIGGGQELGSNEFERTQSAVFAKVDEKMKANLALQYHEALKLVASEHPALNRKYTQLSRARMTGREE